MRSHPAANQNWTTQLALTFTQVERSAAMHVTIAELSTAPAVELMARVNGQ